MAPPPIFCYSFAVNVSSGDTRYSEFYEYNRDQRLQQDRAAACMHELRALFEEKESRARVLARTHLIQSELQEVVLHPDRLVHLRAEFSSETQRALLVTDKQ